MDGQPGRLKVDGGVFSHLDTVGPAAGTLEQQGYDGCWTAEANHDPFLPLVLAAEHTSDIELGTNIAVAFARNPMILANVGWDLQTYSRGRFILGLGSQIRPHIEKRFSMPWGQPVPRMREFIGALRAIWSSWQSGAPLQFEGDFYSHTLMTPMFTPEPQPYGLPKIFVAAVGAAMTEMCGEVADGLLAHPFTSRRYLEEVTLPAVRRGLLRAGRDRRELQLSCSLLVITGSTDAEFDAAAESVRRQIAFYGSTPAYRKVLELHGWGDLHDDLHRLSREGQWDAMGALIDDEMLDTFAVVAAPDELAALAGKISERCAGVADRVLPGLPYQLSGTVVRSVLSELRGIPAELR